MPYFTTITDGLPSGWWIAQDNLAVEYGSFQLFCNGVHVASGEEYGRDVAWAITHFVVTEKTAQDRIADVMQAFREQKEDQRKRRAEEFFARNQREREEKARLANKAVLGEKP